MLTNFSPYVIFIRTLDLLGAYLCCNERELKKMRVKITLACGECKQRNYDTMKNKKNSPDRIEMNKYCRFCRKHTAHKETK